MKVVLFVLGGILFVPIVLYLAIVYANNSSMAATVHRSLQAAYPNDPPKSLAANQVAFTWSTGEGWRGAAVFDLETRELRGGAGNGISNLLIAPLKDKDGKTIEPPRVTDSEMEKIRQCLDELQPPPRNFIGQIQPQGEFDIAFWRDGKMEFYRYSDSDVPEALLGLGKCVGVQCWMNQQ